MKTISKVITNGLIACAMAGASLCAQSAAKGGFVRLANAVAKGEGPLTMQVDGGNVNEKGYKLGDVTGGIGVASGMRTVRFSRAGTKAGSTRVQVDGNETTILIPFAEKVPATDEEPAHWAIRVLRLKQQDPEEEKMATFVSVSRNPEVKVEMRDPEGKWKPFFVKRLAITQAPVLFPRGYVPLRTAQGDLASIPVASKGNYVVLLYDDDEGKVRSVNFKDRKFLSAD